MHEVTRILNAIDQGDPRAAEQLLPLVYDELRKLAAQRLADEKPGQTLQATALVHEAYLRLVDAEKSQQWDSRGHFFAAAAEAMRRILVEGARHKNGLRRRADNGDASNCRTWMPASKESSAEVLALNEALEKLRSRRFSKAAFVKLRYFAGLDQ